MLMNLPDKSKERFIGKEKPRKCGVFIV